MPGIHAPRLPAAIVGLARPYNVLLPAIGVVAGALMVHAPTGWRLASAVAAFVLIHSAITIWNDLEDQPVDELNGITAVAEYRRRGWYGWLWGSVWGMLGLAAVLALGLPAASGGWLAVLVVSGWLYNSRPVQASRRPLASMAVLGLCYGFVPVALGISLGAGPVPAAAWLLAASWTAGRLSLSLLKDYKDARGDAAAGKKTFLLVYGSRRVAAASLGLATLGFAGCIGALSWWSVGTGPLILLALVAGWLLTERRKLLEARTYVQLNEIFHRCLHYQLAFDGLVALCLITS